MIAIEHLQPFCSTDSYRPMLLKPFADDAFTYATDGRILAFVPGRLEGAAESQYTEAARKIADAQLTVPLGQFRPFPQPSPDPERPWIVCDECNGVGCEGCDHDGGWAAGKPLHDALFRSVYNVDFLNRMWRLGSGLPGGLVCSPAPHFEKYEVPCRMLYVRGVEVEIGFVLMPVKLTIAQSEAEGTFGRELL